MSPVCYSPDLRRERRTNLLRQLAVSLEHACEAVRTSDVRALKAEVASQRALCGAIAECIGESGCVGSVSAKPAEQFRSWAALKANASARTNTIEGQLEEIELRVAQLNQEYAALLRRARRTVDIFCRLLAQSPITYSPPAPVPVRAAAGGRI